MKHNEPLREWSRDLPCDVFGAVARDGNPWGELSTPAGSSLSVHSWFPTAICCSSDARRLPFDQMQAPKIISMRVAPAPPRCFGYDFPILAVPATPAQQQPAMGPRNGQERRSATRIRPPDDIVKLRDRLYYVLQPSLETLLRSDALSLPHQPFPYQLEGIGFLYPRHSAILADEMGLGKTMQAITTLRLLLHSREVQNVLLICPKPLISNWLRELSSWAPEIPVTVVQGHSQQRRWAWQRSEFPIKIANYESVLRDVDLVHDQTISADLVVLDEAQRIKKQLQFDQPRRQTDPPTS